MKNKLLFLLVIASQIILLSGQDYLWPLKISDKLSGTFGEYRSKHFHSALDIKTNHSTGYPVYAASDGYIWRIVEKSRGYGKAIYLKMENGKFAVYSHLQGFSEKIERIAEREQHRLGRYRINKFLKPGEITIQKGEKIAYTGQTGTTAPHLHFEIRTAKHKPVNPLLTNLSVQDKVAPKVKSVALVPLSEKSRINGSPRIHTFQTSGYDGNYKLEAGTISAKGKLGLEIKTHDVIQRLPHEYGPYIMKLFVDDSLAFIQQCDTLSFKKTNLIRFDRDNQLMKNEKGRYIRLWRYLPDSKLPFYKGNYSGVFSLEEGRHAIKIIVKDFNGNTSRLKFDLYNNRIQTPVITKYNQSDKLHVELKRDSSSHLYQKIQARWISKYGNETRADFNKFSILDNKYKMSFNNPASTYIALKLITIPVNSNFKQKTYIPLLHNTSYSNIDLSYTQNPATFTFNADFASTPDSIPEFLILNSSGWKKIKSYSITSTNFITKPIGHQLLENSQKIAVKLKDKIVSKRDIKLNYIEEQESAHIWSSDSVCSLKLNSGSVYREINTDILQINSPNLMYDTENVSSVYRIFPSHVYFKNNTRLSLKINPAVKDCSQISIYKVQENDFNFKPAKFEPKRRRFSTEINSAGQFTLLRDTEPPLVKIYFPEEEKTYNKSRLVHIKAEIKDQVSGIKDAMSISLNLDGKEVIPEYNAASDIMKYEVENLSEGKHNYQISVTDRMGNTRTIKNVFYVK